MLNDLVTPLEYEKLERLQNLEPQTEEVKDYAKIASQHLIPQGLEIQPPEIVFEIKGIPMLTKKSLSLLIAKAKAGKTTVAAWIIAQAIKQGLNVLWIDTEQGLYYGSRTQYWILKIADLKSANNLSYYDIKIHAPDERIKIINALIEGSTWDLVVVDGVRDLVFDINSPQEATNLATDLMRWAEVFNCHILTIIHQNKGDGNARGHSGAELTNKSETVVKVSQNDCKEIIVEPEYTRSQPFETFALKRDEHGIPYLIENWIFSKVSSSTSNKKKLETPTEVSEVLHYAVIQKIFSNDEELKSADFLNSLMSAWSTISYDPANDKMNISRAKVFQRYYVQENYIIQLTGQKGNTTINKMNKEKQLVKEKELVNQLS